LIIIDACVAVKWYADEDGADIARRFLEDENGRLGAPEHVLAEVSTALTRSVRRGTATPEQVHRSLVHLAGQLSLLPLEPLIGRSIDIALAHGISIYDALYVAAADRHDAIIVTADVRLIRALAASPFAERVRALGWSDDGPSA
jgi:predicted nucleic acid-binding protein